MPLGRAYSVAVNGLHGEIVEIEADITGGLPGVHLVGLPDAALQESRDRVRSAITNSKNKWPMSRLTLALSPATLPKVGSVYDVALACAVLSAARKKSWPRLEKSVLLGELALELVVTAAPEGQLLLVEVHDGRNGAVEQVAIVADHQHREAECLAERADKPVELALSGNVDACGRLIQHQQVRRTQQGAQHILVHGRRRDIGERGTPGAGAEHADRLDMRRHAHRCFLIGAASSGTGLRS